MALNGISTLATKELRQKAKLDLAATNRAAQGNARATYDITQLPTQYNDNDVINNPNLAVGVSGIKKVTYTGYHTDDVAFTDTATLTDTTTATNFNIASIAENTTVLYTGYLLATYTGTWTFTIISDDASYLWIGNTAVSGYSTSNELTSANYEGPGTGTISLTAGQYYPIRLLYGNGPSGGSLTLTYAHTGQIATSDFSGKLFSPSVSLVQGRPWITTTSAFTFYEAFGTTAAISTTRYVSGNKIYAESSTYDVPSYQPARVIVNDIEVVNTEERGHTLVILDSYGNTVSITNYDTFETVESSGDGGAPARLALQTALASVETGNIVILVVYDASSVDSSVRSAINTGYESTNSDTWTATRKSHILIGEKVEVTTPSLRSFLSPTGQTAYDAASADSFFAVSSTDWDAVVAGVASTSTVGPSDVQFTGTTGNAFSSGYIITYPQANATVPANNYIIGFRATTDYTSQQYRIYGGPTFKSTSPVYSQISTTSPATSGTGTFYYLRKAPTVQAATTYIGIYGTQTLTQTANAVGFWVGGGYTSGAFTTWSPFANNMPKVQVLITPTAVT